MAWCCALALDLDGTLTQSEPPDDSVVARPYRPGSGSVTNEENGVTRGISSHGGGIGRVTLALGCPLTVRRLVGGGRGCRGRPPEPPADESSLCSTQSLGLVP
jgi:hypothetical protein